MLFRHPAHPDRAVRLAYCLNLHPAETLDGLLDGLRRITIPLRERLAPGKPFGVGMYLPARLAHDLAYDPRKLVRLGAILVEAGLDPFTYNAFPYGSFDQRGLKERVFEPTWACDERVDFTHDVAKVACWLLGEAAPDRHISISTHTGMHASVLQRGDLEDSAALAGRAFHGLSRAAARLAELEASTGHADRRLVIFGMPCIRQ